MNFHHIRRLAPALIFCVSLLVCCQAARSQAKPQQGAIPCNKGSVFSIDPHNLQGTADLSFLKALVADKRIVLLGESSHGIGDYYALKSRIIMYLHQECGFDVLAMESGIADIHLTYRSVDTLSAKQVRNRTVFGNFQCEEIMPLFNYIKSTAGTRKPLLYSGFDSQNFVASLSLMQEILHAKWGAMGDSLMGCITKYFRIPSIMWAEDRKPLFAISDSISGAARKVAQLFRDNSASIQQEFRLSAADMQYLQRALQNHQDAVQLDWTSEDPSAKRDEVMAKNLFWLMDSVYANRKIIVWAHNGHIGRTSSMDNPYKWLGQYVSEKYGPQSYHIGLFSREGETFEWWTKSNKAFLNDRSDDLEQMAHYGKISFIDFRLAGRSCAWPDSPAFAYEPENGGRIRFIPRTRFDAIINLQRVSLPTYGK
jgi:erythromycin esterase